MSINSPNTTSPAVTTIRATSSTIPIAFYRSRARSNVSGSFHKPPTLIARSPATPTCTRPRGSAATTPLHARPRRAPAPAPAPRFLLPPTAGRRPLHQPVIAARLLLLAGALLQIHRADTPTHAPRERRRTITRPGRRHIR